MGKPLLAQFEEEKLQRLAMKEAKKEAKRVAEEAKREAEREQREVFYFYLFVCWLPYLLNLLCRTPPPCQNLFSTMKNKQGIYVMTKKKYFSLAWLKAKL